MSLITCREVSFSYDNNQVVGGLNFSVHSGDYLCIAGENGSGKSTLLKSILGLKSPSAGTIIHGESLSPHEIGYLPQQTAIQKDFPASVYEVALSGRLNAQHGKIPFFTKTDHQIAIESLHMLSIQHLKRRCYRELSGGQQQRVLLARALCAAKRLLLLDEPVAGLDPLVTQELYQLIEKINLEKNLTVIMVSHDIKSAVKYASHVLHLKRTQAFFGKTKDYCRSDIGIAFLNC